MKSSEKLALEFFKRLDEQGDVLELFCDDGEIMYPKWGVARGKSEMVKMFTDLGSWLKWIKHDYTGFNYIVSGNQVCVEGVSRGGLIDGTQWHSDDGCVGRFCSVVEINGDKISRLFVYLDPDYCDSTESSYPWKSVSMKFI